MQKFSLIPSEESLPNAKFLGEFVDDLNENETLHIYSTGSHLVIYIHTKGVTSDTEYQIELPIESVSWIVESIEDKFWKEPSEGGLDSTKHFIESEFSGEKININRNSMGGDPETGGFNLGNLSRKSHVLAFRPQVILLTDRFLKGEFLDFLKSIN